MKKHVFVALLVFLLLAGHVLPGQAQEEVTAEVTAVSQTLNVGDPVALTLRVQHPAGYRVLAAPLPQEWGAFEVREQLPPQTTTQADGSEMTQQTIVVTLWAPGEFATPPLEVTVSNRSGALQNVTAAPITLTVLSVLTEESPQLRDIKPQATLAVPPLWPWVVGGLLAGLLAVAIVHRWWQQRQRKTAVAPAVDNRLPYQVALDELAQIEAMNLPQQGRFKEHYTRVSDVLRHYLQATFAIPAMDQTTAEIRQSLRPLLMASEAKRNLFQLLRDADLVKFAKWAPDVGTAQAVPAQGRQFVLATRPPAANGDPPSAEGVAEGRPGGQEREASP